MRHKFLQSQTNRPAQLCTALALAYYHASESRKKTTLCTFSSWSRNIFINFVHSTFVEYLHISLFSQPDDTERLFSLVLSIFSGIKINGNLFASSSYDGFVCLWTLDGNRITIIYEPNHLLRCIGISGNTVFYFLSKIELIFLKRIFF